MFQKFGVTKLGFFRGNDIRNYPRLLIKNQKSYSRSQRQLYTIEKQKLI